MLPMCNIVYNIVIINIDINLAVEKSVGPTMMKSTGFWRLGWTGLGCGAVEKG